MKPKSVIFDLDGTLVSSSLDFLKICKETGCTPGQDILQYAKTLSDSDRTRVESIIYEHEMRDAESAEIIDGVESALDELALLGIRTAIVTRNSAQATQLKLERVGLQVEKVLTREDAPPKPAPDALLNIATLWQHNTEDCVYVGDFRYDLEAANNAGMHAAWFANGISPRPAYSEMAHFSFNHYDEFIKRLSQYWLGVHSCY